MNFPAACVGVHFNTKLLLGMSFVINGVLSCLTPFLITFTYNGSNKFLQDVSELAGIGNWRALVALRAIQGIFQVCTDTIFSEKILKNHAVLSI